MTEPALDDDGDAALWERMQRGDAAAYGELFTRHGARIHGYVVRRTADPQLADDVTAIVFLELWRRRAAVELTRPSALPWLYGVASNVLRNQQRSRRRFKDAIDSLALLPARSPELVERQAEAAAEAADVVAQVRRLPRRERDVLVLSVWEGLSHAEIAEALGITIRAVRARLAQARHRLRSERPSDPSTTRSITVPVPAAIPAASTTRP